MKKKIIAASLFAALSILGGCETTPAVEPVAPIAKIPVMTITGSATYRERIALQPGMVFDVKLLDVSRADAPSTTVVQSTRTLNGEQVPLPFQLQVTQNHVKTNMRYVVRATILTPDGRLAWTTDTSYPIDPTKLNQDLGTLVMVRTGNNPQQSGSLLVSSWQVQDIGGTGLVDRSNASISFASDGAVTGTTGCNRFGGTYQTDGNKIAVGPLAVTQMACAPSLNVQESRMLSILNTLASWQIDTQGRLVLTSTDGRTIVASKQ